MSKHCGCGCQGLLTQRAAYDVSILASSTGAQTALKICRCRQSGLLVGGAKPSARHWPSSRTKGPCKGCSFRPPQVWCCERTVRETRRPFYGYASTPRVTERGTCPCGRRLPLANGLLSCTRMRMLPKRACGSSRTIAAWWRRRSRCKFRRGRRALRPCDLLVGSPCH